MRQIMVHGQSHLSVADSAGLHKQSLSRCCNLVRKQYLLHSNTPDDWVTATVSLPSSLSHKLESIKQLEIDERLKARLGVSDQKLSG